MENEAKSLEEEESKRNYQEFLNKYRVIKENTDKNDGEGINNH